MNRNEDDYLAHGNHRLIHVLSRLQFYLSFTGQPIQPQVTGLAIGVLLTFSYFVTTGRLPFWTEPEEEDV